MFVGKARSLPLSRAPERYFTWVGSGLTCKHKTRPGTNALAYYEKSKLTAVKSFIKLATGAVAFVIKLFRAISYDFL
jgi:hypothetical protein